MAESESVLLERFVSRGDRGAFAEIVRRYAGLVYGTCIRVLADADKAADATQETFFQLMNKAGQVRGSLAGWLHRVAVRKAVDLIRSDSARRRRESHYLQTQSDDERTWQQIAPHVDAALEALDEQTRALLVRHYLEGCSMTELASESGISRPTVSRRIESGLTRLRAQLQKQGVLVGAAGFAGLLTENAAQSAPSALFGQLGKMALLGTRAAPAAISGASGSAALTGGVVAVARSKLVVAAVAAVVVGAGVISYKSLSSGPSPRPAAPAGSALHDRHAGSERRNAPPEPSIVRHADAEAEQTPSVEQQTTSQAPPAPEVATDREPDPQPVPMPAVSEPAESSASRLDLSSPEATVRSFVRAMVAGDGDAALACFVPDGEDYEDMQEAIFADPDDPVQRSKYEVKLLFEALDPDAEMPVLSVEETEHGTSVVWQVTFKSEFTIEGHTFNVGETMEFDGTFRRSGGSWQIYSL